ncbi:MAG: O-antigen ligase family protein, partial [Deltaproteobacteria bacterium]|nr:O-antigen ligase family protein [Deltaproteobacteria bacterium]
MARDRQFSLKDVSLFILYFLLFFAPLAIGGVHDATLIAAALLSFSILFFYLIDRHLKDKHFFISRFFYILAGSAAFVLLQIIPLPDFIVSFLSPKTAGIYRDSAMANGDAPPSFHPLSTAPYRTVIDFIKIAGAAFLFLGVMNLSRREARARRILRAVCFSAGAVILTGLLHFWTGADEILWFYKPQKDISQSLFFTTFVNENNLAGFMNLAFFLCVGFIFDGQGKQNKAVFFLLAISCLLAIVFTSSRGGLSALTAGALVFAAFYALGRLKGGESLRGVRYLIAPVFLAMFAIFTLFYMLYDSLFQGPENVLSLADQIRASLITHSFPAMGDFPLTGSGKGSFAFIFPQYWELPSPKRFVHLENEPLQLVLECGIPFGIIFIAAAISLFAGLFSRVWFKPLKLGALTGIMAVCIASLADFAMEYAGTSTALIAVLGAVCGLDLRRQIHESKVVERVVRPKILAIIVIAFFISAAALSAALLFAYSGKNHVFNPADCESFLSRGNKLLNGKSPDEAEPLLKRSHELCPSYFSPSLAWAKLLIVKKDQKGAGSEIGEILEYYPARSEKVFDAIFSPRNKPVVYAGLLADEGHSIL